MDIEQLLQAVDDLARRGQWLSLNRLLIRHLPAPSPNEFDRVLSEDDAQHEVLFKPVSTQDLVGRVAQRVRSE